MDAETRYGLVNLVGLSEDAVNSIEDDEEVHAALKELVDQATLKTYQRLLRSAAAEKQVTDTAAEADRLESMLEALGVSYNDLSSTARSAVSLECSAAAALQLQDTSPSVLLSGAIHVSLQASDQKLQQLQAAAAAATASARQAAARGQAAAEALRRVDADLSSKEGQLQSEREQAVQFAHKAQQYEAEVAKCEASFQPLRADPQLMHDQLEALGREVEAMHSEVQQVEAQLEEYHGLPASLLGAQLELRNLREQLASTRLQLEQGLAHY